MDAFILDKKLDYLGKLTELIRDVSSRGIEGDIRGRMQRVCDSIERDLMTGKSMKGSEGIGLIDVHDRTVIRNALNDRLRAVKSSPHPLEKGYLKQLDRLAHLFE